MSVDGPVEEPAVTVLVTAHMKPTLRESLASILAQTRLDIQILVVDSGQWRGQGGRIAKLMTRVHRDYHNHPLIEWTFTGEGADLRQRKCPVAYVTNNAIRAGLVRGRYMCTFYDDDRYEPTFVERMAGYLDTHDAALAVWCSEIKANLNPDGSETPLFVIAASSPKFGSQFCDQVDGAQIMWRREVLDVIGDPWIPEDPGTCYHSDGLFLDKLGAACGVVPNIPEVLVIHRFTPLSTYTQRLPV